jgi:hypothetical protein
MRLTRDEPIMSNGPAELAIIRESGLVHAAGQEVRDGV